MHSLHVGKVFAQLHVGKVLRVIVISAVKCIQGTDIHSLKVTCLVSNFMGCDNDDSNDKENHMIMDQDNDIKGKLV
jgi:hypothetical protein